MASRKKPSPIAEDPRWVKVARRQHAALVRFATKTGSDVKTIAFRFRDFREKGYHRSLGYGSFAAYAMGEWPKGKGARVVSLERLADLFVRIPGATALLKGHLMDSHRLSRIREWIESEQDILWFIRLSRATTQGEFYDIADCLVAAWRTGHRSEGGRPIVIFLRDAEAKLVAPYLPLEEGSQTACATLGAALAALCRRARDAGIPGAVGEGGDMLGATQAGGADRRLDAHHAEQGHEVAP